MLLYERQLDIPPMAGDGSLIGHFNRFVANELSINEAPVRLAVTKSGPDGYECELGVLADLRDCPCAGPARLFDFTRRETENIEQFNAVLLVPTGIGAVIGGHAGDANPVARLLASACDTLVTHPNVVNASDINELPDNALYVEGSTICQLLMGAVAIEKVRSNRVILVIDHHRDEAITELVVNSASAARATLGLDCPRVVCMDPPIRMQAELSPSGSAVGRVEHLERLCRTLSKHRGEFDAIALATLIEVDDGVHNAYFQSNGEMVNPWGGAEAMLTHTISMIYDAPSAHAPMMESLEMLRTTFGIVDPRMAAEAVSRCFLHCVLNGLHRSPRIIVDPPIMSRPGMLTAADISCLVIPDGCLGLPTLAAMEQGIPVIAVRENKNCMRNDLELLPFESDKLFVVDSYLEAVGVMTALQAGVAPSAVRRPLTTTVVTREQTEGRVDSSMELEDTASR